MTRSTALALTTLAIATALAPVVVAEPFTHSGEITPVFVAQFVSSMQRFTFELDEGDTLTAALAWESPTTDLDMIFIRPQVPCSQGEPACTFLVVGGAVDGTRCPIVEGETGNIDAGLGPATSSFAATAASDGRHEVWLYTSVAVPGVPVAYTLSLDVGGRGPAGLEGPEDGTLFVGSPHCKWWWGAQRALGDDPGPIL